MFFIASPHLIETDWIEQETQIEGQDRDCGDEGKIKLV